MPNRIRIYSSRGTFWSKSGLNLASTCEINSHSDGEITLTCTVEAPFSPDALKLLAEHTNANTGVRGNFSGLLDDNKSVEIELLHLQSANLSMNQSGQRIKYEFLALAPVEIGSLTRTQTPVIVKFGITNFVFTGCQWSTTNGSRRRDTFTSLIDGLTFTFKQLDGYDGIVANLEANRDILVTSDAVVTCEQLELQRVEKSIYDVLCLLSLAAGTWLAPVYEEVYFQSEVKRTVLFPAKTFPYRQNERLIDNSNLQSCDTEDFLQTTYPIFKDLKQSLGLNVVIEYYLQAKQMNYLELRYLVAEVAIESLLSHARGYLRYIGNPLTRISRKNSLRQKMTKLVTHFQIAHVPDDFRFIRIRNKLVHEGHFPTGVDGVSEYNRFMNFIDRTLLTIVGYRGHNYVNRMNNYLREVLS